ncbi:dTDP-4-amino-4,6-dideoxygalactose transaminase [Cyclonatronum proteinivorum]|uniref:dTDP-4-amino-4,6-dideoxygalactose transaminase n=1 Tax=Cyclonatronum proteinivorum TaxID=1457365 RepID=A0A345UMN5_9BACT|nr:DegT/DnrJ/EryC1/StrS family aminotransferase [Cyclonatronum proteinivorum]AXJ01737.1 dTDP-4-amino-4,6-dideoxygalactose transaminase [Cyclonatronum proteinivorum]
MIPPLDLAPEIDEIKFEIEKEIYRVLKEARFINGPEVRDFERQVASYLGVKHAIGVNSGTDALVISLRALGIGPGDEVITTPFSFFASAESVSVLGAEVVFADVDEKTFNIDPAKVEARITPRTKAIIPVHLYGRPANMGQILEIAQKHKLAVLEDCAQSFGATYQAQCAGCTCEAATREKAAGLKTGALGDMGAFSFFPSKNLGAFGDGGLITTNSDSLAAIARKLHVHGAEKKYYNQLIGYNSRLDTIQAAVLNVKLPHVDRWNNGRRTAAQLYDMMLKQEGLSPERLVLPEIVPGHVFHQYTVRLQKNSARITRDELVARLKVLGVNCMVYYPVPLHQLPVYSGQYPSMPVSEQFASEVFSLPLWPLMTMNTQEQVVAALKKALLG